MSNKNEYPHHTPFQSRRNNSALRPSLPPCNKIVHHDWKWPFLLFLLLTRFQSQQLLHFDTETLRDPDPPHRSVPCCLNHLGLFPMSPPSHRSIPCTLSTSLFLFIYLS